MTFSPLQHATMSFIVVGWMIMTVLIAIAIYHVVRVFVERAKLKAAHTEEQRRALYTEVSNLTKILSIVLTALCIIGAINLVMIVGLIADMQWAGYKLGFLDTARSAIIITVLISGVISVVVLGTRPGRSYEDTIWHLRDEVSTGNEEGEKTTGQEEPASA